MALWVVRHAQPLVEAGICYGALDLPADAQATSVAADALARVLPQGLVLRVSPLKRCQQLALALQALRPDVQALTDPRLREMDFGVWEGVAWDAIPPSALQAWTEDFGAHRFGGIESANEVLARVATLWDEPRSGDAAWITHAGVARALSLLAAGVRCVTRADQWPRQAPGYGTWYCLQAR